MLIKNSAVLNNDFVEAFSKLMTLPMPAKQCLEVASCVEEILGQYQILIRARKAIADKYCLKDNGVPLKGANDELLFETEEIKAQCQSDLQEIYNEEIDISLSNKIKIKGDQLMTPIQVRILKDVIDIEQ
jgi:hypothetical protein